MTSNAAAASGSGASAPAGSASARAASGPSKGFARASSPAAATALSMSRLMSALPFNNADGQTVHAFSGDQIHTARRAPIQLATAPYELLGCVPGAYREVMKSVLTDAMKAVRQLDTVNKQLAAFTADKAAGRTPTFLKGKVPSIQFVGGFIADNSGLADPFTAAHQAFTTAALDIAIERKLAEREWIVGRCNLRVEDSDKEWQDSAIYKSMSAMLDSVFVAHKAKAQIPQFSTDKETGNPVLKGWKDDDALAAEYVAFLVDVPVIFQRAVSIVEDQLLAEKAKEEKKRVLKDTVMGDLDQEITAQSIQSMVDKRVTAALKSAGKSGSKKPAGKVSSISSMHVHEFLSDMKISLEKPGSQAKRGATGQDGRLWKRGRFDEAWNLGREGKERREEGPWTGPLQAQQQQEGEREGMSVDARPPVIFRYDSHRTYPDWLIQVPLPTAARYIVERIPIVVLESMRYRSTIHMIDCDLPRGISLHLSAGMKYMIPTKFNTELISQAWDDFVDRLRWSTHFKTLQRTLEETDDFDPDYAVRHETRKPAEHLDRVFEYGILEGSRAIAQMVSRMPANVPTRGLHFSSLAPPVSVLRNYLTSHQLVVLVTDKNLGCAVASRTWIIGRTHSLLSNPLDYEEISREQAVKFMARKMSGVVSLAGLADTYEVQPQLPGFFKSTMQETVDECLTKLPIFYVIPKIHKNPVSARPILPCHSVVQGPAGKFVSKLLKPVIRARPTIIHGTKDLVLKLSKLSLPYTKLDGGIVKRLYFVSGDVVAFYPNVDVKKAHDFAIEYYAVHASEDYTLSDDAAVHYSVLLRKAMSLADDDLLCQFDGKFYRQARGLAMGVACSPDLANLYGSYFEEHSNILGDPDVAYYGRYIDDCLGLVYATSEASALAKLRDGIKFDNCTIEWTSSSSHMTFLDMTLFFDRNCVLQHKPYRKPMNHFERLPWISAHPLYVKKGTFLSELSRIATLSSQFNEFADACREVADIYIARGYPPMLIASWLRNNYRVRWDARLRETSPQSADVLVLKSEYNISWDLFNVQTLAERMKAGWKTALKLFSSGDANRGDMHPEVTATLRTVPMALATVAWDRPVLPANSWAIGTGTFGDYLRLDKLGLLDRRLIVAKRRTTQIIDLASVWRKSVLEIRDKQASKPQPLAEMTQGTLDWWLMRKETAEERVPVVVPGYID